MLRYPNALIRSVACLSGFALSALGGGPSAAHAASTEVNLQASVDGVTLGCTWQTPPGDGTELFAAAALLTVAGPDDRHQTVGPHRLFADLADGLAERGIATLRCDDHGVGTSTGDWLQASYELRADDAVSMAEWMRSQTGVDPLRVGFIGNSEGGAVGPLAAALLQASNAPAAFVVLLGGPGVPAEVALSATLERTIAMRNLSEQNGQRFRDLFAQLTSLMREANQVAMGAPIPSELRQRMITFLSGGGAMLIPRYRFVPANVEGLADLLLSPWYRSQYRYQPAETLGGLQTPILAMTGAKDTVLPAEPNLRAIEELLADRLDSRAVEVEGLNHVFQVAETGSPLEYAKLPAGFAPQAIAEIANFVHAVPASPAH